MEGKNSYSSDRATCQIWPPLSEASLLADSLIAVLLLVVARKRQYGRSFDSKSSIQRVVSLKITDLRGSAHVDQPNNCAEIRLGSMQTRVAQSVLHDARFPFG